MDLRSPRAIRDRAEAILALVEGGRSELFTVDWSRLAAVTDRVVAVTRTAYPDVATIPYHSRWRHFGAGGVDRWRRFEQLLAGVDERERLRARFDLVITSVLLDAGAGARWVYGEPGTGVVLGRSEGLAIASWHMFTAGRFSSAPATPLRADADGLARVTEADLARDFQVRPDNPMVGLAGRAALLRRLGEVVGRPGDLADVLLAEASGGALPAAAILALVLERLGPLWPRVDVWPHPHVGLVPFHKLQQWLTYSLFEPLESAGVRVVDADELTGLAEYRNGGLFVDEGLVVPRDQGALSARHAVGDPFIVEWRALTVALLDRTAAEVRKRLGLDAATLPLAKVLEGGTWSAGRQIARELRADAAPPIQVDSDGTVF